MNRISSEIPSTTSGITRGASISPDTRPFAKNFRRTSAIAAGTASAVAKIAVNVATSRLVRSACEDRRVRQEVVIPARREPTHGNDTISLSLNEKMIKITIGA